MVQGIKVAAKLLQYVFEAVSVPFQGTVVCCMTFSSTHLNTLAFTIVVAA
jgi:hypothetical protein